MPEEKILICHPTNSPGYMVPGSLPSKCSQCGRSVTIAPSSWLLIHDNPGIKILCESCGFAKVEARQGKIEGIAPAQLEEIDAYFREENR
jgi:DNA-directed RNA polymerase subunit RPC12/RpoP